MRKALTAAIVALVAGSFIPLTTSTASAEQQYVEYYRDNLFLGLAYHRIGCLTNWYTIQSNQDYDGFTYNRYCFTGSSSNSVPNGSWFDWNYTSGKSQLDGCGSYTNWLFDTPNYQDRSNSCSYNILNDCNSDCWIRRFSSCQGWSVSIASPCWGDPPNG